MKQRLQTQQHLTHIPNTGLHSCPVAAVHFYCLYFWQNSFNSIAVWNRWRFTVWNVQKPPHPHPMLGDIKLKFRRGLSIRSLSSRYPPRRLQLSGAQGLQTDSQIWLCWFNTADHRSFSSAGGRAGACPPKFTSANTQFSFNGWGLQVTRLSVQLYHGNSHQVPATHQSPCHGLTALFRYCQLDFRAIAPWPELF